MEGQRRPRGTSVSSYRERPTIAERRGSFLANGVLHPPHMVEPGLEGYRTPTGEDFENADPFNVQGFTREKPQPQTGGTAQLSSLARQISENAIEEEEETSPPPPSSSSDTQTSRSKGEGEHKAGDECSAARRRHRPHLKRLRSAAHQLEEVTFLGWRQRLRHFTWSYFTITMATGGIANVMWHIPFHFTGRYTIGCVFFLMNVVFFVLNVTCMFLRFWYHPETFRNSFTHPTESLFAPSAVVSFGTILLNISQYGTDHVGGWLNTTVMAFFWTDVVLAFVASFGTYLLYWSTQSFTIAQMTPVWIFPAYPLLIIGPHAAVLSATLDPHRSAQILVGGFTMQGIGLLVSMMVYSAYIYRLMTQKLPLETLRPGMFVSVGPSAFTASGLSNMAANAQRTFAGTDFMGNGDLAAMVLRVIGQWSALWLWGLALWFFVVAVGAHYTVLRAWIRAKMGKTHRMKGIPFAMTWFSFVFPQTALVDATFAVGGAFELFPVKVVGCVMAGFVIAMWFFVVAMMCRAIYSKHILWPQKGEDKDEGGFKDEKQTSKEATKEQA